MTLRPCRILSIGIDCEWQDACDLLSRPEAMPRWAEGLGSAVRPDGDHWSVETSRGRLGLRFTPRNALGVFDHVVTLPDGTEVDVPLRAVRNGDGTEVMIVLFRQPFMTDESFERDARQIAEDLAGLKRLLEAE